MKQRDIEQWKILFKDNSIILEALNNKKPTPKRMSDEEKIQLFNNFTEEYKCVPKWSEEYKDIKIGRMFHKMKKSKKNWRELFKNNQIMFDAL